MPWKSHKSSELHDSQLGKVGTVWGYIDERAGTVAWYADVSKVQREAGRIRKDDPHQFGQFKTEDEAEDWLVAWHARLRRRIG